MKRNIKKILIIANLSKDDAASCLADMEKTLNELKFDVCPFCIESAAPGPLPDFSPDLIFSLGGDGTVLFTARSLAHLSVPIFAVNLGSLGFITEINKAEWYNCFQKFLNNQLSVSKRLMGEIFIYREGEMVFSSLAMNDAFIGGSGISKLISLTVSIKTSTLGEYKADGIILATPTGSTAYSLAAGGPIINPEMEALIITPVCPFTLSNRPIVLSADEIVKIHIHKQQRTDVLITMDGQSVFALLENDIIEFKRARHQVEIINSDQRNFFEIVKNKLNLTGGPNA